MKRWWESGFRLATDAEFEESKHPRDHGQFSSAGQKHSGGEKSIIAPGQSVSLGNYQMYVQNAANLPQEFIEQHAERINRAYEYGETPEMIAEELKLRYQHRPREPHKTPRQLAQRVTKVA